MVAALVYASAAVVRRLGTEAMNRLRTILADWLFSLSLVLERWSDAVRPMSETGIPEPYDSIAVTTHE